METEDILWGAVYVAGIIVLFLLIWTLLLSRRSRGAGSRITPILKAAREATKNNPKRWRSTGASVNRDREAGTFRFCTEDCAVKASYEAREYSASLAIEYRGSVLDLEFREGKLIGMMLNEDDFGLDHWEVRANAPSARNLLDDVRRAVGFLVYKEEAAPKIYSKTAEQLKRKKAEEDRLPPEKKRKKRDKQ